MMKNTLITLQTLLLFSLYANASDTIRIDSNQFFIDPARQMILTNLSVDHINNTWSSTKSHIKLTEVYQFTTPQATVETGTAYSIVFPSTNEIFTLFFTSLPIIHITTTETIVDEPNVLANFKIIESNQNYLESLVGIQYRGGLSQTFAKKSMEIEFYEDETGEESVDYSLIGLVATDKYNLQAMYNEPLRMRNKTNFDIWRIINQLHYINEEPDAINGVRMEYAELFINDEYRGVYAIGEKINRKLLKLKSHNGQIRGELYKGDDWGVTTFTSLPPYSNYTDFWAGFEYKHPKQEIDWSNLYSFVDFVRNAPDQQFYDNYASKFSQESLVDYFIFLNLLRMVDNTGKNLYIAKYTNDDVYFYIPWDLDGTFGMSFDSTRDTTTNDILTNGLYRRLIHDCNENGFHQRLAEKWQILRNSSITNENIMNLFLENHDYLLENGVYQREEIAWSEYQYSSQHLDYMSEWITDRLAFLDQRFSTACSGVGLNDISLANSTYKVYPNPAKNYLTITNPSISTFSIELYNNLGQLIQKDSSTNTTFTCALETLNSGVYHLKISDDQHQEMHKIVIER